MQINRIPSFAFTERNAMPEGTVEPKIALPELDADCKICGKETDSTAGNPAEWTVRLSRQDGSGLRWTYHQGCVASALTQLSELRAANEWVSVEERLPDVGMGILFDVPSCYGVEIGIWTGNKFVSERTSPYNDEVSWKPELVTSWRNIPQPSPASAVKGE